MSRGCQRLSTGRQRLSKVVKGRQKVVKGCQKVVKGCRRSSKVVKGCQKVVKGRQRSSKVRRWSSLRLSKARQRWPKAGVIRRQRLLENCFFSSTARRRSTDCQPPSTAGNRCQRPFRGSLSKICQTLPRIVTSWARGGFHLRNHGSLSDLTRRDAMPRAGTPCHGPTCHGTPRPTAHGPRPRTPKLGSYGL